MKSLKLTFPSYDGALQARTGHGDNCVLLMIEDREYLAKAGIVLDPDEAWALGTRLRQQARASQRLEVHG